MTDVIRIMQIIIKLVPYISGFFTGLSLLSAAINFIQDNIVVGIILSVLGLSGVIFLVQLYQIRRRLKFEYKLRKKRM
jgi:small basic protein